MKNIYKIFLLVVLFLVSLGITLYFKEVEMKKTIENLSNNYRTKVESLSGKLESIETTVNRIYRNIEK